MIRTRTIPSSGAATPWVWPATGQRVRILSFAADLIIANTSGERWLAMMHSPSGAVAATYASPLIDGTILAAVTLSVVSGPGLHPQLVLPAAVTGLGSVVIPMPDGGLVLEIGDQLSIELRDSQAGDITGEAAWRYETLEGEGERARASARA